MSHRYGEKPRTMGPLELPDWTEFMHYLYLPVRLPAHERAERTPWTEIPRRLAFLADAVDLCVWDARATAEHLHDPYVYVTARRGVATPGNPLNRPGWHCDDFGGTDLNYIWCDVYPTRFLLTDHEPDISPDDQESMAQFELIAKAAAAATSADLNWGHPDAVALMAPGDHPRIQEYQPSELLRLTPWTIHAPPEIPEPGGMRSFLKISVSTHRYNLVGNSRNFELGYEWPMYERGWVRNQPRAGNQDYWEEPPEPAGFAAGGVISPAEGNGTGRPTRRARPAPGWLGTTRPGR